MAQTGLFSENLSKDLEKFGVINPPSDLELAELPVDLQRQLVETIKDTALASEVTNRTPEQREEKLKKILIFKSVTFCFNLTVIILI